MMLQPGPETLRAVADAIEDEPHRYAQDWWGLFDPSDPDETEARMAEECGTAFCIAGHAIVAHVPKVASLGLCHAFDYLGEHETCRCDIEEGVPAHWLHPDLRRHCGEDPDQAVNILSVAAGLLGLNHDDATALFVGHWRPRDGMTVPEALRALAEGADVESVSYDPYRAALDRIYTISGGRRGEPR